MPPAVPRTVGDGVRQFSVQQKDALRYLLCRRFLVSSYHINKNYQSKISMTEGTAGLTHIARHT
jgi:hypothetical protein